MHHLAELDLRYVWHPFTQMRDWGKREPIVITSGKGAVLRDQHGKEYIDANASIWTNLHGHQHRAINRALHRQLKKVAHSSALGLANEPASLLAEKLTQAAGETVPRLAKVFFSDDGSTAMEVALKLSYDATRRAGRTPRFLSLEGAYHGDTVGAVSLGHIDLFHKAYGGLLFQTEKVMAPYCYRCPYNQAEPERADARQYRKCHWECVGEVAQKFAVAEEEGKPITAMVIEPLIQGAAGMIPQPDGWLREVAEICRKHRAHLIADEVMTGFGRTTIPLGDKANLFACQTNGVFPDFQALAKGLTGGYLPMAATLTTEEIFNAFLGEYAEFKTFFHGHSFTGNQLGSAAALASLELLHSGKVMDARARLARQLASSLDSLWDLEHVGDIRQVGLAAGVELVQDWKRRQPYPLEERAGIRVCEAMALHGVLTRPIGNVIVIMPPYCATASQMKQIFTALRAAIRDVLG